MSRARRKSLPTEPQTASIESLSHDGRGVARLGGKTTFIDGALVGEQVQFVYTRQRRDYDEGRVVAVVTASAARITPFCPSFGVCGGCSLQHLAADAQLDHKQQILLDALQRIGRIAPDEIATPLRGPTQGYRRKARLGVKYVQKKGRVLVGFRERQGRYLADMQTCPVLAEPVGRLLPALAERLGLLAARERIPQIEVACGDNATTLALRHLDPLSEADRNQLIKLAQDCALQVALQPAGPDSLQPLWPENQALWLAHPDFDIRLHFFPTDFVQVNATINRNMVAQAIAWLDPQPTDRVLDLFCGLGNFTLPLARRAGEVIGVEGDAAMVERARANAALNGLEQVRFYTADLTAEALNEPWAREPIDLALLDPPRAGAGAVLPALNQLTPKLILYVSCHPGTLARDAYHLVHEMGYTLARVGVLDMFPHTSHVETMALFRHS